MEPVVICHPVRTPVGGFMGSLAAMPADELATVVVREVARRGNLVEGDVDDVILGNCNPSGEFPAIGRIAALNAGLGIGVPACRSTAAAAPASRPCSTARCRSPPGRPAS